LVVVAAEWNASIQVKCLYGKASKKLFGLLFIRNTAEKFKTNLVRC